MKAKSQFHSDFFFVIYIVVDTIELQTVVVFVDYFFCFPVLLFFLLRTCQMSFIPIPNCAFDFFFWEKGRRCQECTMTIYAC